MTQLQLLTTWSSAFPCSGAPVCSPSSSCRLGAGKKNAQICFHDKRFRAPWQLDCCAIINGNYYSPRSSPRGLNPTRHKTGRRPRRKPSIRFSGVGAPAYQLREALGGNRFTSTLSSSTIGMLKTVLVKKFPMRNGRVYCRQDSIRPLIHDSAEMVPTVS